METTRKVIGKKLAKLRIAMGMTQEEMARYLGIATSTLRLFEQGKTELSPRLQAKVSQKVIEMVDQFPEIMSYRTLAGLYYSAAEKTGPDQPGDYYDTMNLLWKVISLRDNLEQLVYKTISLCGISELEDTSEGANLRGTVSPELLDRFNMERQDRELTSSELLELILKYYYDSLDIIGEHTLDSTLRNKLRNTNLPCLQDRQEKRGPRKLKKKRR